MALEILESSDDAVLSLRATDYLTEEDLDVFFRAAEEKLRKYGKARVLLQLQDFRGWAPGASGGDSDSRQAQRDNIERFAIVGDTGWEEWLARIYTLLLTAQIKHFSSSDLEVASQWVSADEASRE